MTNHYDKNGEICAVARFVCYLRLSCFLWMVELSSKCHLLPVLMHWLHSPVGARLDIFEITFTIILCFFFLLVCTCLPSSNTVASLTFYKGGSSLSLSLLVRIKLAHNNQCARLTSSSLSLRLHQFIIIISLVRNIGSFSYNWECTHLSTVVFSCLSKHVSLKCHLLYIMIVLALVSPNIRITVMITVAHMHVCYL